MALFIHLQMPLRLFFIISFTVFVLPTNIKADNNDIRYYNIYSNKYIKLEPDSTIIKVKYNGTLFIKPDKMIKNAYLYGVNNILSSVDIENDKTINLDECKSIQNFRNALKLPFLAVYDESGLFKYMKVSKSEVNLSIKYKLIYSIYEQINKMKFENENSFTSEKLKELTPYGNCDINYNVTKQTLPNNSNKYIIIKNYNMKSCTPLNENNSFEKKDDYIKNFCSDSSEPIEWSIISDQKIEKSDTHTFMHNSIITEHLLQKALKNSLSKISLDQDIITEILPEVDDKSTTELKESDSKIITKLELADVNNLLFENSNNKKYDNLREVYRALACDPVKNSIYLELMEYIIQCNEE